MTSKILPGGWTAMSERLEVKLDEYSCPNPVCQMFGKHNAGNISVRCRYGPAQKLLLYCRTCGKKFAATTDTAMFGAHLPTDTIKSIIHHAAEGVGVRATARLLNMHPQTVNNVILRIGKYCGEVMSTLLHKLDLEEVQLDELWSFIKKKNAIQIYKNQKKTNWTNLGLDSY
jgi:transposase-like protein